MATFGSIHATPQPVRRPIGPIAPMKSNAAEVARQDRIARENQARQDRINAQAEKTRLHEQARQDRLNREADRKAIALARINAAGVPQSTLNSVLTGIQNLQRQGQSVGETVGAFAPPVAPSDILPTSTGNAEQTATSGNSIWLIVGAIAVAIWFFFFNK